MQIQVERQLFRNFKNVEFVYEKHESRPKFRHEVHQNLSVLTKTIYIYIYMYSGYQNYPTSKYKSFSVYISY